MIDSLACASLLPCFRHWQYRRPTISQPFICQPSTIKTSTFQLARRIFIDIWVDLFGWREADATRMHPQMAAIDAEIHPRGQEIDGTTTCYPDGLGLSVNDGVRVR